MRTLSSFLVFSVTVALAVQVHAASSPVGIVSGSPQPSRSAAGNSFSPQFSANGQHLVFVSQANNLVTNDDMGLNLDVFVRDLARQKSVLVSVSSNGLGGANLDANYPCISSNGQHIAFASAASNLVPGDTNNYSDVFIRDLAQGRTWLVSVDASGSANASGDSTTPLISADGRRVLFVSEATNLVAGEYATNQAQVYLRDLESGQTRLLSVNASGTGPGNGPVAKPALSADGQWAAFQSTATDLVAGVTNTQSEVYLRNLSANITTWASAGVAEYFLNSTNGYRCFNPVLNQAGTQLAFKAMGSESNRVLLFLRDLARGVTTCITSNALETGWPELSTDGRFLVYESQTNILVWDNLSSTNLWINQSTNGIDPGNGPVQNPTISADGSTVVFLSDATDLTALGSAGWQIFARSLAVGQTRLVSRTSTGDPSTGMDPFIDPAVSTDGQIVAFPSENEFLVPDDRNRASDIFLHQSGSGQTELVTVRHDSLPEHTGTAPCYMEPQGMSSDGRYALISSFDNSLSSAHTNRHMGLYHLDLHTGNQTLILPPSNRVVVSALPLASPALSLDGVNTALLRYIPDPTNVSRYPYAPQEGHLYDATTGAYQLFNLDPASNLVTTAFSQGSATPTEPPFLKTAFSPDGRKLAFAASDTRLVGGSGASFFNVFLWDLAAKTNQLVSRSNGAPSTIGGSNHSWWPQFSPDGRWLCFYSKAGGLFPNLGPVPLGRLLVWEVDNEVLRLVDTIGTNASFSADSRYLVYDRCTAYPLQTAVYMADLLADPPTNHLIVSNGWMPVVSFDAEVIAFQTWPTNKMTHIFATNRLNNQLEFITVAPDGVTPGDGPSGPPQITPNGRYVLFASKASNLVTNDDNRCSDVFLRDRTAGVTYLLSANPKTGHSGNGPSANPLMSADGSTILFASFANDLVAGDYNDKQDIFVVKLGGGDSDADGLDDNWELAYLNTLIYNGASDPDGDGMSNASEYRAGTDPSNRGSALQVLLMGQPGGANTTLLWPVVAGKTYQAQFKGSVTDAHWTDLTAPIEITGSTARTTDPEAGLSAQRFYRVVVVD